MHVFGEKRISLLTQKSRGKSKFPGHEQYRHARERGTKNAQTARHTQAIVKCHLRPCSQAGPQRRDGVADPFRHQSRAFTYRLHHPTADYCIRLHTSTHDFMQLVQNKSKKRGHPVRRPDRTRGAQSPRTKREERERCRRTCGSNKPPDTTQRRRSLRPAPIRGGARWAARNTEVGPQQPWRPPHVAGNVAHLRKSDLADWLRRRPSDLEDADSVPGRRTCAKSRIHTERRQCARNSLPIWPTGYDVGLRAPR